MRKTINRLSTSFVAYLCLLCGFAALGLFVYASATASLLSAALGAAMLACFGASAATFRTAARTVAERNESGIEIDGANVWARPLRRAQVDQYLSTYRRISPPDTTTTGRTSHAPLPSRRGSGANRNTSVSRTRRRDSRQLPKQRVPALPTR